MTSAHDDDRPVDRPSRYKSPVFILAVLLVLVAIAIAIWGGFGEDVESGEDNSSAASAVLLII